MQQSKGLYFKKFFQIFCSKAKNVENNIKFWNQFRFVRIGHLCYELWHSNYLQRHHRQTKVVLRYVGPFPTKRRLRIIDTLVLFSENLTLQNALGAKV